MNDYKIEEVLDIPELGAKAMFSERTTVPAFREDDDILPVEIDGLKYMPWGSDNLMPYRINDIIESDETFTTCLQFTAELCYGSGLVYNTDGCSESVSAEVDEFVEDNNIAQYYLGVCQDLKHFAFAVSVIILNNEGTRIVRVYRKNAIYCRFAPVDKSGRIPYILYGNWRKQSLGRGDVEQIELLDPNSPLMDLRARMGLVPGADGVTRARSSSRKFTVLTVVPTADSTYYPIPFYGSLLRSNWYEIKRLIAVAKKSKLKNSAPLKYHIEINDKYFNNIFRSEGITDPKKRQERVKKAKEEIIDFLTGVENSGKVWFSEFFQTPDGKESHEVRITKVENTKEGGDWESDIAEAINIMCFTLRVHSNLVGSVPGKSQTNNSGSDKRELYTIAQALQKPYHDLIFVAHRLIMRFNDWKGCKPECPFIQLTTLDENKDAKQVKIETT